MITKDSHSIDWNKTAQVTGVVVLTLGKGIWWLAKRGGLLLIGVLGISPLKKTKTLSTPVTSSL